MIFLSGIQEFINLIIYFSIATQPSPNTDAQTTPQPAQQAATQQQDQAQPTITITGPEGQADGALLMGEQYNTMVTNIMDMG